MKAAQTLSVVAYGAASPIGLSGAAIGAASYTNLDAFRLIPRQPGQQTATLQPDVPPADDFKCSKLEEPAIGDARSERIFQLLDLALQDLPQPEGLPALRDLPWLIALPQSLGEAERAGLKARIHALVGQGARRRDGPNTLFTHRAGLPALLDLARALLLTERAEGVVLAAADSLVSRDALERLDAEGRLLGPLNGDGLIPGEAAAAFVVSTPRFAGGQAVPTLSAWTQSPPEGDPTHIHDLAQGLTRTFHRLRSLPPASAQRADRFLFDGSGESRFIRAAAIAYLRAPDLFPEPFNLTPMAASLGDTGAATMAMQLVRTLYGATRGWDHGPTEDRTLLVAVGDCGTSGALLVERPHG